VTSTSLGPLDRLFDQATWDAFQQLAVEGRPAGEVARELGMTVKAVVIGSSRLLRPKLSPMPAPLR